MYKGKILELIREKSSTNGNPRFTAVIQGNHGFITMATTAPDSSLAYGLSNYTGDWVNYQTKTVRGRLTLVSVEHAELSDTGRYIRDQFDRLPDSPVYSMQVRGCSTDGESGRTNWVNVTGDQLVRIQDILKHG